LIAEALLATLWLLELAASTVLAHLELVTLKTENGAIIVLCLKILQRGTEWWMMAGLSYLVCLKTASKNFTMNYRLPTITIPVLCKGSGWCSNVSHDLKEDVFDQIMERESTIKNSAGAFFRRALGLSSASFDTSLLRSSSAASGYNMKSVDCDSQGVEISETEIMASNPLHEELPLGWVAEIDEYGAVFFFHKETGEIRRTRPGANVSKARQEMMEKTISYKRIVTEQRNKKKNQAKEQKNKIEDFTKQEKRKFDFRKVRSKTKTKSSGVEMKTMCKEGHLLRSPSGDSKDAGNCPSVGGPSYGQIPRGAFGGGRVRGRGSRGGRSGRTGRGGRATKEAPSNTRQQDLLYHNDNNNLNRRTSAIEQYSNISSVNGYQDESEEESFERSNPIFKKKGDM